MQLCSEEQRQEQSADSGRWTAMAATEEQRASQHTSPKIKDAGKHPHDGDGREKMQG
jgi:hypothetical protein